MARFSHIAGDVALDIVNTVEWRLSDDLREEDLNTYEDVVAWCVEAGLVATDEAAILSRTTDPGGDAEHDRVIGLREALYRALFAHDAGAHRAITQEVHEALCAADYVPADGGWRWRDRGLVIATPRHRISRAIMALLSRGDLGSLHQCEDAQCGWVFLDTSRAHNRRWCATKGCGDRNRSRDYYARKKDPS